MFKKNKFILLLILGLFMLSFCGCQLKNTKNLTNTSQNNSVSVYPMTIVDTLGRNITISKKPGKIISLAPSNTEILFELGVGERIVGVTDYDDYPETVKSIDKVSGFKGANIELIAVKKPDVIFASTNTSKDEVEKIETLGIPVVVSEAKSFSQIYDSIKLIGQIIDKNNESASIISRMKEKISQISDKTKDLNKIKVYYSVEFGPNNWTAGKGTFIDEIITIAGGTNIASDVTGWVQYSLEKIVRDNPDIILASSHAGDINTLNTLPGFKDTNAVKNGKIAVIDDNIIVRPGPRIIQGLEATAKALHPEVFNK